MFFFYILNLYFHFDLQNDTTSSGLNEINFVSSSSTTKITGENSTNNFQLESVDKLLLPPPIIKTYDKIKTCVLFHPHQIYSKILKKKYSVLKNINIYR